MATSIQAIEKTLREFLANNGIDLLEKDDYFFGAIEKVVPITTAGSDTVVLPYSRSAAFAQAIEFAEDAEMSKFGMDRMEVKMVKFYSKLRITDYELQLVNNNNVTIAKNYMKTLMKSILDAPKNEFLRLFFADNTGKFADVSANGTGVTKINVDFWWGEPNIEIGRVVKIGTKTEIENGTADERTVIWVGLDYILVDTATDVATWDIVVDKYAYEAGAGWKKFTNLEWITDDGTDYGATFQNKDRTTDYLLQGNVITGTSNVLTDIDNALRKVSLWGKTKDLVVVCGLDKYNDVVNALISQRNITTSSVKELDLAGGYKGIQYFYNGKQVKIVPHAYAKKDRIYVFDTNALRKVILTDNSYINDGGITLRPDKLGHVVYSRLYGNIAAFYPRKTAKIKY